MRSLVSIAALLAASLLLSCGAALSGAPEVALVDPVAPELEVRPEEREHPSLQLRFPYANRSAMLGYGGVQMWARPVQDEIRVDAIIDAPAKEARWTRCETAELVADGRAIEVPVRYIGRPMQGGIYDAVQLELGIHQLRAMARARHVAGAVCGDPIALSASERRLLARFVRFFDRIAEPRQHGDAPAFREVGPKLELLPIESDDPGPYPA